MGMILTQNSINFVGIKINYLTVLSVFQSSSNSTKIRTWALVKCECGIQKNVLLQNLKNGSTKSCGCSVRPRIKIGDKFSKLIILEIYPSYLKGTQRIKSKAKVICDCDNKTILVCKLQNIIEEKTRSCKICLKKEFKTQDPLYTTWSGVNRRCYNKNTKDWLYYGSRGISNFWKNDSAGFIKYINENLGPKPHKHSLDRIDNNGNYEPGNIRWADAITQVHNQRGPHEQKIKDLELEIKNLKDKNKLLEENFNSKP